MGSVNLDLLEERRLEVQRRLDGGRSAAERNRRGQFATPPALAAGMLAIADEALAGAGPVRLLDPAVGTGVFFAAALRVLGERRLERAWGYEIDPATAAEARRLWGDRGLEVRRRDFCAAQAPARGRPNLVVCNPPYVRHHHLPAAAKESLRRKAARLGFAVSGLAGLYAYFLLLADAWLAPGGAGVWIVPAEFLDVNYGRALRAYLAGRVTLLRVHRFDPASPRFDDALVTSAIVAFRKAPPPPEHETILGAGALDAARPSRRVAQSSLDPSAKWSPLWHRGLGRRRLPSAPDGAVRRRGPTVGDLFCVRRGIATGANAFFILDADEAEGLGLAPRFLRPVLPPPRCVRQRVIERGTAGFPRGLPRRVVLDCALAADEVAARFPALDDYLRRGRDQGIDRRYLARHREPWYRQEQRPPAPILCTYMGRRRGGRFVRFIRNRSGATATNVYHLLYPRAAGWPVRTLDRVFEALRAVEGSIAAAGRTYGGGLVKIEPRELESLALPVRAADLGGGP